MNAENDRHVFFHAFVKNTTPKILKIYKLDNIIFQFQNEKP